MNEVVLDEELEKARNKALHDDLGAKKRSIMLNITLSLKGVWFHLQKKVIDEGLACCSRFGLRFIITFMSISPRSFV